MAVIKAVNSKNSINGIVRYVIDDEKTEEKLISAINCIPETVLDEMKFTKENYGKTKGRQYKHFIQSFHPQDKLTPQKSNEIGLEWAEQVFNEFEVLVVTHMDKEHLHNHFIVNSVSFKDGKKFGYSKWDLENFKKESDNICRREGLSVIERNGKRAYIDQATAQLGKMGLSWKMKLIEDIKDVKENKTSFEEFIESLENHGYEIKLTDNKISFKAEGEEWFVGSNRLASQFGEEFLLENLKNYYNK
ncbi:MAG: relaxase/mobilization nuclease domain-containing protein [Clostridium sp.]